MSGGHFTAVFQSFSSSRAIDDSFFLFLHQYGKAAHSDNWFHFNDARVTQSSHEEVISAQPYILIYERSF